MSSNQKAVVFLAGNEEYAVPIQYVHSIERPVEITPIPHMPAHVLGVARIRNDLVPLIDLENVLYQSRVNADQKDWKWILVKTAGLTAGIAVRDAREIVEIPEESIKGLGIAAYRNTSYISGVASLPERSLIAIINPDKLINSLEGIKELKEYLEDEI